MVVVVALLVVLGVGFLAAVVVAIIDAIARQEVGFAGVMEFLELVLVCCAKMKSAILPLAL